MGFHMLGVAVGWQLYELTGSALDLGLVGPRAVRADGPADVARRAGRRPVRSPPDRGDVPARRGGGRRHARGGHVGGWQIQHEHPRDRGARRRGAGVREPHHDGARVGRGAPAADARAMAWLVSANQTAQIVGPALGGFFDVSARARRTWRPRALFVLAGVCAALIRSRRTARTAEPLTLESVFSGIAFIRESARAAGHDVARHVRGAARGRATALLPIYARDILGRARAGSGSCARPGGRRAGDVDRARAPSASAADRAHVVSLVFVFGAADGGVRRLDSFALSLVALCVAGRGGRHQRRHPRVARPDPDARHHARAA